MANWIHDIEIKNFKSIRHAKVEDCRRINVFIGYPNVGKSNVLEALSLFSIGDDSKFDALIRIENDTSLLFNGNIDLPIQIVVNSKYQYKTTYSNGNLSFRYQYISEWLDNRTNQVLPIYETLLSFQLNQGEIKAFNRDIPRDGRVKLSSVRKYEFDRKIHYHTGRSDRLIEPFGENLFEVISAQELIRKEVSELFSRYDLKFSFDKSTRTFKILKNLGDDIFLISYPMIADTLQRLIFYKAAIATNHDSVLLFEEPEAHMFPPYISKFTSDIWYNKDNQYFMATHSPFVLNDFLENARDELAIYVLDYQNGETIVKRLTEEQVHDAYQYGLDLFLNVQSLVE